MTFDYQIKSDMGISGSLGLYAAVSFLGFLFMYFFVKESKGLTDLKKKQLYLPIN